MIWHNVEAVSDNDSPPAELPPERVYTPESELRSPVTLLRSMIRDLLSSRELAWRLMVRDLSARYRQSVLGILWAFLLPIASAAVFVLLRQRGVINIGETSIPYPAFAIIGTVLWAIFAESLTAPLSAVAASSSMLAKVNFPREALLLSAMGQLLFGMAIKLSIVAVVFAYYQLPLSWTLLPALGAVLLLMLLGFVIGLFLMPLGTLYTDVSSALTAILGLWFFLTPVVYPPPQQWPYSLLAMLNPVSPLLAGARELATQGTLSNPLAFAVVALLTVLGFFVVWVLYRISLPILVERMHA